MDPIIAAALAETAGSVAGGAMGAVGAHRANKSNARMAREQMDFQERMSNTQYQRTMDDMRKAGLNPILAAKLGGASSPSGAMANAQNEAQQIGESLGKASSSAREAIRMKAEIDNIKATTDKTRNDVINNNRATDSLLEYQRALTNQSDTTSALNAVSADNIRQNMGIKGPLSDVTAVGKQFTSDVRGVLKQGPNLVGLLGKLGVDLTRRLYDMTHRPNLDSGRLSRFHENTKKVFDKR